MNRVPMQPTAQQANEEGALLRRIEARPRLYKEGDMKLTNKHRIEEPVYRALKGRDREFSFKIREGGVSLTRIINPLRQTAICHQYDDEIVEDVSDRFWLLFGSAMHHVLEEAHLTNSAKETSMSVRVAGWTIYMRSDLWRTPGIIHDFKFSSVWSHVFARPTEYEAQLNGYMMGHRFMGWPVTSLRLTNLYRDWQKSKAHEENYPPLPTHTFDIAMWPMQKALEYFSESVQALERILNVSQRFMPKCTPEERWAKPDAWAVVKQGNKRASRVVDSEEAALEWIEWKANADSRFKPDQHDVVLRTGESTRCLNYCAAAPFCEQWAETKET